MNIKDAEKKIRQAKALQKRLDNVNKLIAMFKKTDATDLYIIAGEKETFNDDLYYNAVALKNRIAAELETLNLF